MTDPYRPKLIEVALPLVEISEASSKEKSVKHGHPANLHMWWARRPLASARAVLWASLVDDPSGHPDRFPTEEEQGIERERLFSILERLVPWEASGDQSVLEEAQDEIRKCFGGELPTVLDPFGGGGAIPIEAQRLGLNARSGDLNPVAVLVQKGVLEIPRRFAGRRPVHPGLDGGLSTWTASQGLAADVGAYGEWLIEQADGVVGDLYPTVHGPSGEELTPIAWIWARTVLSPDPSWRGHVPLVKSWIVSKKPKKPIVWVEPIVDHAAGTISYEIRSGGTPGPATVARGQGTCVATGTPIPADYIKAEAVAGRMGSQLIAIAAEGARARVFLPPDRRSSSAALDCPAPEHPPTGLMSTHPQYMGTPRYGLDHWHKLFTNRQLTTLTALSDLLPTIRKKIESDAVVAGLEADGRRLRDGGTGAAAYADAIVTYLAFALDKLADLNNSLAAWEPVAQCPRHLFGRQSVSMVWDYAEANPFSNSSGSFRVLLEGLKRVLEGRGIPAVVTGDRSDVVVEQRDAAARVAEVGKCVVCTDPPYYAQVPYADISDFFYVWMRRNLGDIWPDECATLLTPKAEELVADEKRHGSKAQAAKFFETGMSRVFAEVAKVQDPRVPATIFYAFKQAEETEGGTASTGWETFLQGLLDAGLAITATWPIRTENKSRLRAMNANALASSVVLACRPRAIDAALETRGGFVAALRSELPGAVRILQQENIAPVDLAQSAIGPGMRIFSRYARVVEADGSTMPVRTALLIINEILGEVLSEEEAELDPDTRFALTWFEQFAHNPGPYGDADVLARAKDTSVAGVVESGIVVSRDGKVRLLERNELDDVWSPLTDTRSTVWEATQHLIGKLNESESAASHLLATLGGLGARARQLAYLLFGVCERKGWADEAIAYNGLITAWPELSRLAASGPQEVGQQTLI
jgi:putative DNA methylase